MIEWWYGMFGGRSLPQSKNGLTTTLFGMNGAESVVDISSGSPQS